MYPQCTASQFRCSSGQCVDQDVVCYDGKAAKNRGCKDNSHLINCSKWLRLQVLPSHVSLSDQWRQLRPVKRSRGAMKLGSESLLWVEGLQDVMEGKLDMGSSDAWLLCSESCMREPVPYLMFIIIFLFIAYLLIIFLITHLFLFYFCVVPYCLLCRHAHCRWTYQRQLCLLWPFCTSDPLMQGGAVQVPAVLLCGQRSALWRSRGLFDGGVGWAWLWWVLLVTLY